MEGHERRNIFTISFNYRPIMITTQTNLYIADNAGFFSTKIKFRKTLEMSNAINRTEEQRNTREETWFNVPLWRVMPVASDTPSTSASDAAAAFSSDILVSILSYTVVSVELGQWNRNSNPVITADYINIYIYMYIYKAPKQHEIGITEAVRRPTFSREQEICNGS